ncbi:hypothetical protein [[Mycoplasma] gypis]|uniref:ECM-binding protein homolog n=1 Tax=[Mycoplasma] gypis TaxID=92404 RepID=A0ABZ2RQ33_9BACT|nr:hypothetical protein [[Mycoplasma] gypis]MBN0919410.1 hypothetical protein [[Mycoplasma] gypis]
MANNKKMLKAAIIANAILATGLIGTATAVASLHTSTNSNIEQNLYDNFEITHNLYKKYQQNPGLPSEVLEQLKNTNDSWKEETLTLEEKIKLIQEAQNSVFDSIINNLDSINFNDSKQEQVFWKDILNNQFKRIRELDLINQFLHIPGMDIEKFTKDSSSMTNEQKAEFLKTFKENLNSFLKQEDDGLKPYLEKYEHYKNYLNEIPFPSLKQQLQDKLNAIYEDIIAEHFRFNDLDIQMQHIELLSAKINKTIEDSKEKQDLINDYLAKTKPYKSSEALGADKKQEVKEFLALVDKNLHDVKNIQDIENIAANVQSFYEQLTDNQRSETELKEASKGLKNKINDFNSILESIKEELNTKITDINQSYSKDDIISKKSELFNDFYLAQSMNKVVNDWNNALNDGFNNGFVTFEEKQNWEDKISEIINANIPLQEKNKQLYELSEQNKDELFARQMNANEINRIRAQVQETLNSKYITDEVKTLGTDLENRIKNLYLTKNISSEYLALIKKDIEEKQRQLLKAHLKNIEIQSKDFLNKLYEFGDDAKGITNRLENLNKISNLYVEDFNPVTSAQLDYQIRQYNMALQDASDGLKAAQTKKQTNFTAEFLDAAFQHEDGSDFTENEKTRINAYRKLKGKLDKLLEKINNGDSDENTTNEIAEISAKLQNMVDTAQAMKQLSDQDEEAKKVNEVANNSKFADQMAPITAKIDQLRDNVNKLFANPDATKAQIEEAQRELEEATKNAKKTLQNLELNDKLAKLKAEIMENFGDSKSPAAQAAWAKYNELKEKTLQELSSEEIESLSSDILKATDVVGSLFNLEIEKQRLIDTINDVNSDQYHASRVKNETDSSNNQIRMADKFIKQMNTPRIIPNLKELNNQRRYLQQKQDDLRIAYQQDKIVYLNNEIQKATRIGDNLSDAVKHHNEALNKINTFAQLQKDERKIAKVTNVANNFEKFVTLAKQLDKLVKIHGEYDNPTDSLVAIYVANVIAKNELLSTDDAVQINKKNDNVKKAIEIARVKKIFNDKFNSLQKQLVENQNWKIYQSLNTKITELSTQKDNVISDSESNIDKIQANQEDILVKAQELLDQKNQALAEFEDNIIKTNDKKSEIEKTIRNFQKLHSEANFDKFEEIKTSYTNDLELNRRDQIGNEEIIKYRNDMEVAFYKDLAWYQLQNLRNKVNNPEFGSSQEHQDIKKWTNDFVDEMQLKVNSADDAKMIKSLMTKISSEVNLGDVQKNTADYISKIEANPTRNQDQINSVNVLKNVLKSSAPKLENEYSDLEQLHEQLQAEYENEVDVETLRQNVIDEIGNRDAQTGTRTGIRQLLNEKLNQQVGGFDKEADTEINKALTKLKEDVVRAITKNEVLEVLKKVTIIKNNSDDIVALANKVYLANRIKSDSNTTESLVIKKALTDLDNLIKESRINYANPKSETIYQELIEKITFQMEKVQKLVELNSKLQEIKEKINNTDFFNYEGVNGLKMQENGIEWVKTFETTASKENITLEELDNLIHNTQSVKETVELQKKVSDQIKDWKDLQETWNLTDQKLLIKSLWESAPSNNSQRNLLNLQADSWLQEVLDNKEKLADKLTKSKELNTKRKQNNDKVKLLNQTTYEPNQSTLEQKINVLVNDLYEKNKSTESIDDANELSNKLDILVDTIDKLKELASITKKLDDLNNATHKDDSKSRTYKEKQKVQDLINENIEMYIQYQNSDKLQQQIDETNYEYDRLLILTKYEWVLAKFLSNTVLEKEDRQQILHLMEKFEQDFDANVLNYDELNTKYFADLESTQSRSRRSTRRVTRSADENQDLIKTALENSNELRRYTNEAQNYVNVQNTNLDSPEVSAQYNVLKQLITRSNEVLIAIPNVESDKVQTTESLKEAIERLVQLKRDQIQQQLEFDKRLKQYVENNKESIANGDSENVFVERFEENAIQKLEEAEAKKDDLSYSQVNDYLQKAIDAVRNQIFKAYNATLAKVTEVELLVQDYILDFSQDSQTVRLGSNVNEIKYQRLVTFANKIQEAKQANYTVINSYDTKLDSLIEILTSGTSGILNTFISDIQQEFNNKMDDTDGSLGFYKKLFITLQPLLNNVENSNKNYYQYIANEQLQEELEALENKYNSLLPKYKEEIKNTRISSILANFATIMNELNHQFFAFQANIKQQLIVMTDKNPLIELFADLYSAIRLDTESAYTDEIKAAYQEYLAQYREKINKLINNQESLFDSSVWDKQSTFDAEIFEALHLGSAYKNWIYSDENKERLFKQLDENPESENPLPKQEFGQAQPFEHKYQVAISKDSTTREKFLEAFNEINSSNNSELLDITNADSLLELFDQFAYTKKDIQNSSQLASVFSQSTFRVKIKKFSDSGWFDLINQTQDDVDRKSLNVKVQYIYQPSNTNIEPMIVNKTLTLTFKTLDKIQIQNGNSSIFFDGEDKVGIKAKVLVFNVEEAGWISDPKLPKNKKIEDYMKEKAYNIFKKVVFEGNPDVDRSPERNSRESLLVDANSNNSNFKFLINTQESLGLTFNISLFTPVEKQKLRIIPDDRYKQIGFLQVLAGKSVGFPTRGWESPNFTPQQYDNRWWGSWGKKFGVLPNSNWWEVTPDSIKPVVTMNAYKFTFDYDKNTKNLYIYNSWVENAAYVHRPSNVMKNEITKFSNNMNVKEEYRQWAKEILKTFESNPNYFLTSDEFRDFYAYFSAQQDKLMRLNPNSRLLLPSSSSDAPASFPIWPLNGGQAPVRPVDGNLSKPQNSILIPVMPTEFSSRYSESEIVKASARQSLYSASINEFWFKIRK